MGKGPSENDRREGDYKLDEGLTERVLMSTVVDLTHLSETVERIKFQVFTLAREKGILRDK